jgi:hypothetical protein
MKRTCCGLIIFYPFFLISQTNMDYKKFVHQADSLYKTGKYIESANMYSQAFKTLGWKGSMNDRYNAGCTWALAKVPDSSFYNLKKFIDKGWYTNYEHITSDSDLFGLHDDPRWAPMIAKVKSNKDSIEAKLDRPLVARLDSINKDDQDGRQRIKDLEIKYGYDSKEVKALWKEIKVKDSINLMKVTRIIDEYGWLGPDVAGQKGNSTLFLVIQHADQITQEKYLPKMRDAVKNYKASPSDLALLEDRVELRQGKRQVYGSQIAKDQKTGKSYVMPLDDPDNVDKRRAAVGLSPLAEYTTYFDFKWDLEQYKKELPALDKIHNTRARSQ